MDDDACFALLLIFLVIFIPNIVSAAKNDAKREAVRKHYDD